MVKQRMEFMKQLSSASAAASVSSFTPSETGPDVISCARTYGMKKGQCLAEQHKQIMEYLAAHPVSAAVEPVRNTPHCNRLRDYAARLTCMSSISKSSSSSSSVSY